MAAKKKGKKKKSEKEPEVHDRLKGFQIEINEFGERISSKSMEEINEFLNEEMDDKKLREKKKKEEEE